MDLAHQQVSFMPDVCVSKDKSGKRLYNITAAEVIFESFLYAVISFAQELELGFRKLSNLFEQHNSEVYSSCS